MGKPVTAETAVILIDMVRSRRPDAIQPVNGPLIRKWAERGKVRKCGLNREGRQTYDLDQIKDAASAVSAH